MAAQRERTVRVRLLEGEELLHVINHHWMTGVTMLVIPIAILLIVLGLYIYNAVGGGFTLEYSVRPEISLDLTGWLQVGLVAFIGALWVLLGMVERDGYQGRRWGLLAMALVVVVVIAFRTSGGQLFVVEPSQAQPLHPLNLLLLLFALVAIIVIVYLLVDLLEDRLYLTNRRVIYYNGAILIPRLIEKQVQQDLRLEDVQNVVSRTETYLQHWLNYGNITVYAANAGRPITFRGANEAKEMQRRIMSARRTMLQKQSDHNFTNLINARVYGDKVEAPQRHYPYRVFRPPFFLRWLLDDNPRIDLAQGVITWHPHWFFLARALLWPVASLALIVAAMLFISSLELVGPWPPILVGLLAVAVCALWAIYLVEDYRNDRYILNPSTLVDIDKRPFGPEGRRSAGLATIQTVNYKTTFLSNVLGYGDVVAKTAGTGGAFTFFRVPRPRDVAAMINQYISVYRQGERDRALDEAVSLLREFHEYQTQQGELKPKAES